MEDQQLVQMALRRKFLTPEQVALGQKELRSLADRGVQRTLWFMLQDLGFITDDQTKELRSCISSSVIRAAIIEGYTIQGRLGSGGMGDVFRGRNERGDEVAIKLLSSKFSQHEEYAQRFEREAKATLRLNHPNIARSISAGEYEGQRYLIMEMVTGPSLKEYLIKHGPLDEAKSLVLMKQMTTALDFAYQHGVLHRDVKPANIILGAPRPGVQEPFCAKLCDFGLAKVWQVEGEEGGGITTHGDLTHSGIALGTPHYMSPEQASGQPDLDSRSDIYSLGASIYHALLGQTLYNGKSSAIIMYKQVHEELDLQPLVERGISKGTVRLMQAMLQKDRNDRLGDWATVMQKVLNLSPDPVAAGTQKHDGASTEVMPARKLATTVNEQAPAAKKSDRVNRVKTEVDSAKPKAKRSLRALFDRNTLMMIGLSSLAALFLVGIGWVLLRQSGGGLRANPENFLQVLGDAAQGGKVARILLSAGDYRGPWHIGVAHNHLRLIGIDENVRLIAGSEDERDPLVQLQTGLDDFEMRNIILVAPGRTAIEAMTGAKATLSDIVIDGSCKELLRVSGAQLTVSGFTASSAGAGILIDGQSTITIDHAVVAARAPVLDVRHGDLTVRQCRFSRRDAAEPTQEPLVDLMGGSVTIESMVGEANGCASALFLDRIKECRLRDISLVGAKVGIHSESSAILLADGLTVAATDVAMQWVGSRDPHWTWKGWRLQAQFPVIGLNDVDVKGSGANMEQLRKIPLALVAQ